jgi:hypothetical protein
VSIMPSNIPANPNEINMKTQSSTHSPCGRLFTIIGLVLMTAVTVRANYTNTVLADQPLAFYPINSDVDPTGITATDISGNGNNGTYNGVAPSANSVSGPSPFIPHALLFDGSPGSFVDLSTGPHPAMLNFGGTMTMEAWAQPLTPTVGSGTVADILGKGFDGTNEITLRAQGGNYYGGFYTNGATHAASGGVETTNWTYLVSTYDGAHWNLYVNGVLVQGVADPQGALSFGAPWAIGDGTSLANNRLFQGNLTMVAIYTNALTPAQVVNHFCVGELGTTSSNSIPIIVTQPQPQTAVFGGTAIFSVVAVSALPTTNQWFKNGVPLTGKTNSSLTLTGVGAGDATNYSVLVGNSNGSTNSVSASLTVIAGHSLKWNSGGTNGVWDTATSADWLNLSNSTQTVFSNFDQVLFDDTVGVSNNVIINGTVSPSLITVNSSTNNFSFTQGSSPLISGTGGLVKKGSSTLSYLCPANFTGPVTIQGGTVYAGDFSFAHVTPVTITNNSTLDFGGGSMTDNNAITVSGTGVTNGSALFNSYPFALPVNALNITLAGDTTFGGTARWDLSGGSISGPHKITINWFPTNVVYGTANNFGQWTGVTIAPNVGDIEITNGALGLLNMGTTIGNPAANFLVDPGTELDFYGGDPGYVKNFHVFTNGTVQFPTAFTNFSGNFILENGARFVGINNTNVNSAERLYFGTVTLNGVAHFLFQYANYGFTNVLSGTGGILFDGFDHEMFLQASNTYSGPTVIGGGLSLGLTGNGSISHSSNIWLASGAIIDVSGRADNTLALTSGQTLAGIGTISGKLIVPAGATISPAGTNITLGLVEVSSPTGTINAGNSVTLNGTTVIKLNGSGVNDEIQAGAGITFGGTLNLVNVSGSALAAGNTFQIFSAASITTNAFTINPTTPGTGLAWDTSHLTTLGTIGVVTAAAQPVIGSTKISGGNLIFSGTGGTANGSYSVMTTTNIATPLTSWVLLSTGIFDGTGAFSVTNAINPAVPHAFYLLKTP